MLLKEVEPGVLSFGGSRMTLLDIEGGFWSLRRQLETLVGHNLTNLAIQQAGVNGGSSFVRAFASADSLADPATLLHDCVAAYQAAGFGKFEITEFEWPVGRILVEGTNTFESWMMNRHLNTIKRAACAYTAGVLVGFVDSLAVRNDLVCVERSCQALGDSCCAFEIIPADEATGAPVVAVDPDPGLSHQLNLLDILFDRMPMGIAVFDHELRLRRCNPTWATFIDAYTNSSASQVLPGKSLYELAPGTEKEFEPVMEQVFAGKTVQLEGWKLDSQGIVSYWDVVLTPLFEDGRVVGILDATTDATQRVLAKQSLEDQVRERTHQLEILLDVSHHVASTLELEPLLGLILDQLWNVVEFDGASILELDGDSLRVLTYRGPIPREAVKKLRIPLAQAEANRRVIESQLPQVIPDVHADNPLARSFQRVAEQEPESTFAYIRSWMGVPLIVKGRLIGMVSLDHHQPDYYSPNHSGLLMAFAELAAIAIENARLYERAQQSAAEQERNRLARDLHDAVTQTLFSASLIADILPRLWERDPEQGKQRLEELRDLTRGALAEMRTLLMELRPATLTERSLGKLLRQLTQAVGGRSRMSIDLVVEGDSPLPPKIQVALYRIVQESLNNVIKHAAAEHALVSLVFHAEYVHLSVKDDGQGFDPTEIPMQSLGLGILRERASRIGAALEINSEVGKGTEIVIRCPLNLTEDIT